MNEAALVLLPSAFGDQEQAQHSSNAADGDHEILDSGHFPPQECKVHLKESPEVANTIPQTASIINVLRMLN